MKKYNFNVLTDGEFRQLERMAWNAELDFNGFPAAEYKFFDTIQAIGARHRHDKVPKHLLIDDIELARKTYHDEKTQLSRSMEHYKAMQEAIIRSDELRCKIDKAAPADKLKYALECIEVLTGETGFAERNLR